MSPALFVFTLLVFLFSVVVHEISHGYVAERLGDPTARLAGRLTLNPVKHLDPFGSVILPLLLSIPALFGQPAIIFGWAKPVPYNPYNLKNPKTGAGVIAASGPLSNFLLAGVFGILLRVLPPEYAPLGVMFALIIYVNVLLGVFNLVPIPPLDGSKILKAILPFALARAFSQLEALFAQYGLVAVLGFVLLFAYFLWPFFSALIQLLFTLITGMPIV